MLRAALLWVRLRSECHSMTTGKSTSPYGLRALKGVMFHAPARLTLYSTTLWPNDGRRVKTMREASKVAVTFLSWCLVTSAVEGCSKKPDKGQPTAKTAATATLHTASTAAPVDALRAAIPRFVVVHSFPKDVQHFELQNGLLLCGACTVETSRLKEPRPLHAYEGKTLTDLTSLFDDAKISAALGTSVAELVTPTHGGTYRFLGVLPEPLFLALSGDWDDDNTPRNGSVWVRRTLKRVGNTWREIPDEKIFDEKLESYERAPGPPRDLPRQFDHALVRAPHWGKGEIPVIGGDGPLLVIGSSVLDLWDPPAFRQLEPSWLATETIRGVARLATGYTLVATSGGLHVIGRDGKSQALNWSDGDVPSRPDLFVLQNHLALLGIVGEEARLYRFENDEPLAVPHRGRTESIGTEPKKPPKPDGESIPAMVKFTSACQHPFVVLFTPPSPRWSYATLAANLKGYAALQDHVTFVEFSRNGTVYFGAQADSEENARALMSAYVERVPKAKPQIGCLDAKNYLPDPTVDKWDARTISINLGVGSAL